MLSQIIKNHDGGSNIVDQNNKTVKFFVKYVFKIMLFSRVYITSTKMFGDISLKREKSPQSDFKEV